MHPALRPTGAPPQVRGFWQKHDLCRPSHFRRAGSEASRCNCRPKWARRCDAMRCEQKHASLLSAGRKVYRTLNPRTWTSDRKPLGRPAVSSDPAKNPGWGRRVGGLDGMPRDLGTGCRERPASAGDGGKDARVGPAPSPPLVPAREKVKAQERDEWQMTGRSCQETAPEACPFSGQPGGHSLLGNRGATWLSTGAAIGHFI
jgi:hypothetical protein